ncbi:hypothetical protein XELAEV_18001269mg [Xenopus laevis]|uniref:Uncharacterized protein n=1 Tax=Xenopus laevis TaxID=8355 RepID=A0A974BQG6_XENLA|nr:hypothetical protein XELAEV_18001269mg [Xenopus laevis]
MYNAGPWYILLCLYSWAVGPPSSFVYTVPVCYPVLYNNLTEGSRIKSLQSNFATMFIGSIARCCQLLSCPLVLPVSIYLFSVFILCSFNPFP